MSTTKPARKKRQTRALILWNELGETTARKDTARAIGSALRAAGYDVSAFNLEDDIDRLLASVAVARPDIVFNLVDDFYSDTTQQSAVAGLLDLLGVAYTGSEAWCLLACQDRVRTHLALDDAGVDVPLFEVVRDINAIPDTAHLPFPVIVTQALDDTYEDEGQEHPVYNRTALENRVYELAREYELPLKIESYIEDRRIHAVVVGDKVLDVLPIVEWNYAEEAEAHPGAADEAGHDATPRPPGRPEGYMVAQLTADTLGRVRDLARRAFRAAGCRGYAQIDLHLDDGDKPYVVDVRPTFPMGPGTAFHFACQQTERGFDQIVSTIVTDACKRVHAFDESELKLPRPPTAPPAAEVAPPEPMPAAESGPGPTIDTGNAHEAAARVDDPRKSSSSAATSTGT